MSTPFTARIALRSTPLLVIGAAVMLSCGCGANAPTTSQSQQQNSGHAAAEGQSNSAEPTPTPTAAQKPVDFDSLDMALAAMFAAASERDSETMNGIGAWIAKNHGVEAKPMMQAKALDASADLEERIAACGVLRELGPAADEALTRIVNEADQSLVAANALKSITMLRPAPSGLLDRLMGWMDHDDLQVQRAAVQSLARIGTKAESAAPKLLAILNSPDANETLRGEAKRALKAVNPRRTFQD